MVTLRTDLPFAFGFLYQAGGTAVRQPTDPHSTFALGLSGVASCPRGSPTAVQAYGQAQGAGTGQGIFEPPVFQCREGRGHKAVGSARLLSTCPYIKSP